jgi:pyruvate dehydrogenase E2 component (dihydrolipoamide acetyltransferase)
VKPSGARGEITRADVEFALARRSYTDHPVDVPSTVIPALAENEISAVLPLKGIRGVIADRMSQSTHTTARVTLFTDVDATGLVALREQFKNTHESEWGFAPGYNDLIAKACALALRRFPYMNARINNGQIEQLARINMGIAVDAEKGLYVPVIRDIDLKDLKSIGQEFRRYVDQVRAGKVPPEALEGGTFTITNLGMFEVDGFTPVINLPEAAILGIGRISPKPVAINGQVMIRNMLTLSLVFDHRLVDGAPAARFLQYLKEILETSEEYSLTN